ncbi:F0F1 ATP synthase subunit A [Mycoplasma phocimorsus]|uniref:F0F1 ATP synthase subunit A n=1 Tax=Mycoplasma phocimorsus TaxID=3045839 RepID=A0AAJ1PS40_9MOLU|nr:F0F1 ATP synthase subunit A [Mycoplasma phocimorsus]MDJ1645521.1 F0F1 ATP synthase subunit A [Mycoplasma phocimorsus]MDJ1646215.1 F0F1 ATP synthase subunit A [Mycoplasma phocimorsus]MDJ1646813.1 F0F1 ATP synthase subunit A [Mycoplasma phocimorsus]MDJ1647787.1 F0F1 ATP synthase subunit A [Mycoplasma phocimorsus]MDJ1648656.1 F0F1 ATP synthase subunit A [Mycoplasma phocimorsus]
MPKDQYSRITQYTTLVDYPIVFSLIIVTLLAIIISLVVYFKVRNIKEDEVPLSSIAIIAEGYYNFVNNTFEEVSEKKLPKAAPLIFSIFTFIVLGNIIQIVGFEGIATSYTIPLFLAFISWIGIYIIGLSYQKHRFFLRYVKQPLDLIGQFTPLLTLSLRMFGNIIGGTTMVLLGYQFFGWIGTMILGESTTISFFMKFMFAPIFTPFLHLYFDIFGSIIQAYVFMMITTISWTLEVSEATEMTNHKEKAVNIQKNQAAIY